MFNDYTEKAYIGTAPGNDKSADEKHIAERGAPFPVGTARALIAP